MPVLSSKRVRLVAATAALSLGAPALAVGAGLAPSAAADEVSIVAADAVDPTPVTIAPNPSYRASEPFLGWGTSLVWFANATGAYPEDVREELYQKVFGQDGLNLNIARYNVGGGNASDVDDDAYMRKGGAVEGWWQPDLDGDGDAEESAYANRESYRQAWNPDDASAYDLDADQTQRWWVERLAQDDQITHWEAFSNSPPWFMTESGYATGGFDSSTDQLRPDSIDQFTGYLTRVVEHLEDTYGIDVDTVDPMNEPNTTYWGTWFNDDGTPACCRQEGAHMGPALQGAVIESLAEQLADPATTTEAVISAPDETNPGTFVTDWYGWTDAARAATAQLNVHTYGTNDRVRARDIAKTSGKPLWMSEVEGDWSGVVGLDLANMENGLGMATRMVDDLRELEPTAWVFWQPVEDLWNMEVTEQKNWGSIYIDFDCDVDGNSARRLAAGYADPSCRVLTNAKYNTIRNFTHYIHPGDWAIPTNDPATTAFVSADQSGASLVHVNSTSTAQTITVDLSGFGSVAAGATVTPVVTTAPTSLDLEANALVEGEPVAVDHATSSATLTVPAKSVTTLVVDGVSGVAPDAAPVDDTGYLLRGVGSGLLLTGDPDGTPVTSISPMAGAADAAVGQTWVMHTLSGAGTNERTVALADGAGAYLAAGPDHSTVLVESDLATAAATQGQQWILNSTDGATYSLLNVATTEQLDVAGEGTAPGTTVGTWASSTGAHQRWTFLSTALQSVSPVQVATAVGVAPTFPSTVVPQYPWGAGTPVVVTWDLPGAESWGVPGTVTVTGVGTDVFGTPFEAAAFVDVGDFTLTDPVSTHAFVGASLAEVQAQAPATVPAHVGTSPRAFEFPVVWDWGGVGDVTASVGVVRVPGTVTTPTGPLPAHLAVIVTTATTSNAATLDTTTASATFTEAGYPVDRTRNGVTTDKGWSNWRPGTQRTSDTLTYDFGGTRQVTGARIYFYADGSSPSWASSYLAEYRGPDGAWTPATSQPQPIETPATGAPVVEIDLGDVRADAVRFVLNATVRDGAPVHMVVSEVQIDVPVPTPSAIADLADLRVGGVPVDGFDPADDAYTVHAPEGDLPAVTAFALDGAANVAISQSAPAHHAAATVTVTVTAPDGSTSRTYTVTVLQPRITLTSLGGRIEDGDHLVRGAPILATVRRAQPGTRFVLEMDGQVLARATVSRGGTAVLVGAVPRRADLGEHILAVATGATNIRSVQVTVDAPRWRPPHRWI